MGRMREPCIRHSYFQSRYFKYVIRIQIIESILAQNGIIACRGLHGKNYKLSGNLKIYRGEIIKGGSRVFAKAGTLIITTETYHIGIPTMLVTGSYGIGVAYEGTGNVIYRINGTTVVNEDVTNAYFLWITT